MRIVFTGSRHWKDESIVFECLKKIISMYGKNETTVVVGGAKGLDTIVVNLSRSLGLNVEVFNADWNLYGKKAGPVRNQKMLESGADLVIAFPEKESRGTRHMIDISQKAGIRTIVYENSTWLVINSKKERYY